MSMKVEYQLSTLTREMWFAMKIGAAMDPAEGIDVVFDGLTRADQRADRARFAILASDIAEKPCGWRGRTRITFAEIYREIYGVDIL